MSSLERADQSDSSHSGDKKVGKSVVVADDVDDMKAAPKTINDVGLSLTSREDKLSETSSGDKK